MTTAARIATLAAASGKSVEALEAWLFRVKATAWEEHRVVVTDEQALETMGEILAGQAVATELGLQPQPVEEIPTPAARAGNRRERRAAQKLAKIAAKEARRSAA